MNNLKYIWLLLIFIGFTACDDEDYTYPDNTVDLDSGVADFSNYVALGNSLTSGYTDGALFKAGQNNSLPNILAQKMALVGGGDFTQPYTNDNIGGLLIGGQVIQSPRLYFNGSGPVRLDAKPTTEVTNFIPGPYNNMGIPGAKAIHLLANGYGNIAGLQAGLANPYFVRMASSSNASVLEDAMSQNPTFFSLWIGINDVLGYASTGGDGSDPITDQATFDFAYSTLISTLTSGGAKGVVLNIPNVTSIPFFTTVPHNPVPLDAGTAGALNEGYIQYNGGLLQLESLGAISAEEREYRTIHFVAGQNAVVIEDESLTNLTPYRLPSLRQATADDLLVLTSSSFIGTTVGGNPMLINGLSVPLSDKWVLIPSEQDEVSAATNSFNSKIKDLSTQAGLAFVDANALMQVLYSSGISSNGFDFTADLVTGGVFSLDGVHLTARGSALIADEMLKTIDATYSSNFGEAGALNDLGEFPVFYSPDLR